MTELVPLSLASKPLFGLPLQEIWFGLVMFLLGMFLFLDGFDFGIGILFATRDDEQDRETLLATIGPIWDGNEVWLVVFGGALFAVFPMAYANLFGRYYLLMFAILGALILRGLAPEFYEQREDATWRRTWATAFVAGSTLAPFFLGAFAGNWVVGSTGILSVAAVLFGVALVVLSVVLGAAFLGLRTRGHLRAETTAYGQRAAALYVVLVVVALAYLGVTYGWALDAILSVPGLLAVVVTVAGLAGYVVATRRDAYLPGVVGAGAAVFALVLLVGTLLYPHIDPADQLTVAAAAVEPLSLNLITIIAVVFLPLVLTYFGVLYSVFSGATEVEGGY